MSFESDEALAAELVRFTVSDGDLYRQQVQPILANLAKKIVKGRYDPDKALVLWGYLADNGALKYTWEFGDRKRGTRSWHQQGVDGNGAFPKNIRRLAAAEFRDYYNEELEELTSVVAGLQVKAKPARRKNAGTGKGWTIMHMIYSGPDGVTYAIDQVPSRSRRPKRLNLNGVGVRRVGKITVPRGGAESAYAPDYAATERQYATSDFPSIHTEVWLG